jgi:hypothetical protein
VIQQRFCPYAICGHSSHLTHRKKTQYAGGWLNLSHNSQFGVAPPFPRSLREGGPPARDYNLHECRSNQFATKTRAACEHLPRFWQVRYYDFPVWSEARRIEKLRYIHRNPVRRGLVESPEDWRWSNGRPH